MNKIIRRVAPRASSLAKTTAKTLFRNSVRFCNFEHDKWWVKTNENAQSYMEERGQGNDVARKAPKLFDADLVQAHFLAEILAMIPKFVKRACINQFQMVVYTEKEHIIPLLKFLKMHTHCRFVKCQDITCVDWIGTEQRFEMVYILDTMKFWNILRVQFRCSEMDHVESACRVHPVADYVEREVYDMYGVFFKNHPDLRRILTDFGFQGHPLRKDFPVYGFIEVRYDESKKQVVSEPVELTQEFRSFTFQTPW
jgi:NADH/F420H2 dehydrogenase subunit C